MSMDKPSVQLYGVDDFATGSDSMVQSGSDNTLSGVTILIETMRSMWW